MPMWKCRVCCESFGSKAHFINHQQSHGISKHNGDADAGGSAAPQQTTITSHDYRSGDEETEETSQISSPQLRAPGELSPVDTYQPPSTESSGEPSQEPIATDPQSRSVLLYQMKLFGYLQTNNAAVQTPLWVIDESVAPRLATQHGDYIYIDDP